MHNFTDVREDFIVKLDKGAQSENNTIPANPADYKAGQYVVYPSDVQRELHWIANGYGQGSNPKR